MPHQTDGYWQIRREMSESKHTSTIAGRIQAGEENIMVWGKLSWYSLDGLIIVEGTENQYKYASAFADHVHPYMRIDFPQNDGIHQCVVSYSSKCMCVVRRAPG